MQSIKYFNFSPSRRLFYLQEKLNGYWSTLVMVLSTLGYGSTLSTLGHGVPCTVQA